MSIRSTLERAEMLLTGPLPALVRYNVRTEFIGSLLYGPFNAALLFVPVVMERLGASPDMVALYQSQSYIGLFLAILSVRLIPRKGILVFLAICWTLGRGAFLFVGLVPTALGLLLLSTIFWFSDGFPGSAYTDVVRRAYPADVRGRSLSVVRIGMAVAMLVITPAIGWLLDMTGHTVLYPLAGVFGIAAAWFFTRMRIGDRSSDNQPQPDQTGPSRSMAGIWQIVRHDRAFMMYLLSVVCFGLGGLVAIAFYPAVIVDRLHLSYADVSLLGLAQSVFWIMGLFFWGRVMDRKGAVWVLRLVYLISAIGPLSYLLAGSGWGLLPAYVASGFISGGIDLAFTTISIDFADSDRVYEYASLQKTVVGIRGLIGPFIGVWLYRLGVPMPFIFILGAALYVLGAVLLMGPLFRGKSQRASVPQVAGQ